MFDTMKMAKTIREGRIRKNLTQMALADAMGVSYQAVSNWERGNSMPDISKLEELCTVLDLTLNELLGVQEQTVQKVMQQEELSPEELADVAPVIPPQDLKRVAEKTQKKINIHGIIPIAPFLDEASLEELVEGAQVEDLDDVLSLAPFLSEKSLDALAQKAAAKDLHEVVGLAPFLSEKTLEALVEKADAVDLDQLVALAPFLGERALDRLVTRILAEGDPGDVSGLYPFLGRETMRKLAKVLLEDGNLEQLKDAAPFL